MTLNGRTVVGACSKCGFSLATCICNKKEEEKIQLAVTRKFKFDAAHKLPNYLGKCQNLHGHSWALEVEFLGPINEKTGMVLDFSRIKKEVGVLILDLLDHSYLNTFFANPTAEHIIVWIAKELKTKNWGLEVYLNRVRLYESDDSYTEWKEKN